MRLLISQHNATLLYYIILFFATTSSSSPPESNGIKEGHVNWLKYLKRQMFGRAHLDWLRVKVLHAV